MQAGFCVTSGPQGVTFHRVGRESLKGLLTFHRTTDTAVIVLGRLHYRREVLDMGPYPLTDRLRRGRLLQAWLEAGKSARAESCGVWPILYPFGVCNLLPLRMRDGVGPLLRGGRAGWMYMGESTIPPWIRPQYARRFRLRDRARDHVRRTFRACPSTVLSVALSKIVYRSGDLGRWYLSSPRGVLAEHPFLDPRLLRFLLSVHAHVSPRPRTTPKPVLTEAVRGILPEAIRLRPKGGFFNEPYYRGIAHYLPALHKMVRQCDAGSCEEQRMRLPTSMEQEPPFSR